MLVRLQPHGITNQKVKAETVQVQPSCIFLPLSGLLLLLFSHFCVLQATEAEATTATAEATMIVIRWWDKRILYDLDSLLDPVSSFELD